MGFKRYKVLGFLFIYSLIKFKFVIVIIFWWCYRLIIGVILDKVLLKLMSKVRGKVSFFFWKIERGVFLDWFWMMVK